MKSIEGWDLEKKIRDYQHLLDIIGIFFGPKKIKVLLYMLEHRDEKNLFHGSYEDIMLHVDVSKPTIVALMSQLEEAKVIEKVKNRVYKFRKIKEKE